MKPSDWDGVILGAGLAGLSAAYYLSRNGAERILILEKEVRPGLGSSGKSACMLSQLSEDPMILRFLIRSARLVKTDWLSEFEKPRFWLTGSHHFGSASDINAYEPALNAARLAGLQIQRGGRDFAVERTPLLAQSPFEETLFCPSDGILETDALMNSMTFYLKAKGTTLALRSFPTSIRLEKTEVRLTLADGSEVRSRFLVNAGGAWAGEIPLLWKEPARPLRPTRRHLFVSQKIPFLPDLPILWNITAGIYARPSHDGRLICSPCDEDPHPAGEPAADRRFEEILRKKIGTFMPKWKSLKFEKNWAGLRSFSPSKRFWIGQDPVHPALYWTAALGGNGITASAAAGDLVARQITGKTTPDDQDFLTAFLPEQ